MAAPTVQLDYYHGVERLRYVGNWAATALATTVLGTLGTVVSMVDGYGMMAHSHARLWSRTLLWINGIVVEVEGGENLEAEATRIFIANHQSALDIPALMLGLPASCRALGQSSRFRTPFVGWYRGLDWQASPSLDVRRNDVPADTGHDIPASLSTVVLAAEAGSPEDVRQLFEICLNPGRTARVLLVPVAVINSTNLMPAGTRFADPGSIQVRIGAPLELPTDASAADVATALDHAKAELTAAVAS